MKKANPQLRSVATHSHGRSMLHGQTIAEEEGGNAIGEMHLAEAIGYRSLDRDLWV